MPVSRIVDFMWSFKSKDRDEMNLRRKENNLSS
jgi:hypothetical protein